MNGLISNDPEMPRVMQIVSSVAEESSGPSYSVVRLTESLNSAGVKSEIAALDWAPCAKTINNLTTFALSPGPRTMGWSRSMNAWLRKKFADGAINVLHSHGLWMLTNVIPNRLAAKRSIPVIVSPRGTLSSWSMQSGSRFKKLYWPLLQRKALADAACLHATSEAEYNDIRNLGFRQPIAIIPNGVDLPPTELDNDIRPPVVLFLGRVHPKKGVDILLHAWHAVQARFPDWTLKIVGPDNAGYLHQMLALAKELGLAKVQFTGPLEGKDKWAAYHQARLFVLPTHSENFGIAVAEALSSGLPCIVSKGAPWKGLVENRAGWWIDNTIECLTDCLSNAMAFESEELREMGRRGREWMQRQFDWAEIANQFRSTYEWMIHHANRPDYVVD